MFWKRRRPAAVDLPSAPHHLSQPVLLAVSKPESWEGLTPQQLGTLASIRLSTYGRSGSADERADVQRLYALLLRRLTPLERLQVEEAVCDLVALGATTPVALIPFIRSESDTSIIATATIDCCMLTTRWNNDPLTGPKAVARQLDEVAISPTERLGILTGLLLLGDDRVLPLVKGRWRQIESADDRRRLATIEPVAVSTLAIEFLLDWLEQTADPEDVNAISTTMARMPRRSPGGVIREQRCFPMSLAQDKPAISIEAQWTFRAYLELIRPRLESLVVRRPNAGSIVTILRAWKA
jgi:hypothetical protein